MAKEMKDVISRNTLENRLSNKIIIYSLLVLVLTVLLNLKPSVNNEMTKLYYFISIICLFVFFVIYYLNVLYATEFRKLYSRYNLVDMFLVFIIACTLFQSVFVFGYFRANVDGSSMYPTFTDGQPLIVRSNNDVDNFDVVVVEYDKDINIHSYGLLDGDLLVKRVIAKGGDRFNFKDGILYLNGVAYDESYVNNKTANLREIIKTYNGIRYEVEEDCYIVEEGYYFVMGDNRGGSNDSRQLGLFTEEQIVGKVVYELHSLFEWEKVK